MVNNSEDVVDDYKTARHGVFPHSRRKIDVIDSDVRAPA
jgi:hypothetical protein